MRQTRDRGSLGLLGARGGLVGFTDGRGRAEWRSGILAGSLAIRFCQVVREGGSRATIWGATRVVGPKGCLIENTAQSRGRNPSLSSKTGMDLAPGTLGSPGWLIGRDTPRAFSPNSPRIPTNITLLGKINTTSRSTSTSAGGQ